MDAAQREWYRQGLGPRIEALEHALQRLPAQPADDRASLREWARTLRVSSEAYAFPELADAARALEAAAEPDLAARGEALLATLRRETAGHSPPIASVLIVTADDAVAAALTDRLRDRGKTSVRVHTAAEAERVLTAREIVFIVVDLFLPDADGRTLIAALRSRPLTASIPVVVMAARLSDDQAEQNLLLDADSLFQKPVDPDQIADYVAQRMKRARETQRAARRDLLTGLLNRAAFCEHHAALRGPANTGHEPAALALLKIDRLQDVLDEQGAAFRDRVLRHVAAVLSASFRAMDVIARWELAEFAVLFPGEDQFGGMRAIEKIMAALRRSTLAMPSGEPASITLSAGLTVVNEQTPCDEAMERAAHFLYLAESAGGNRIASSETEGARRKDHILIVSRDQVLAGIIRGLISKNHLPVEVTLTEAAGAPEAARARRCHLALIDADDAASGLDVLQTLRADPALRRIPAIMLVATEAHMVEALEHGANDYLLKPVQPLALLACIRRVLSRGMLAASASTTVLVANDEVAELVMIGTAMHKAGGFKVMLERRGQDALRRILEVHPKIVIWNWLMQDLPGEELLTALSRTLGFEKTLILFVAAPEHRPAIRRLNDRRVQGVVARPIDVLALAPAVRAQLKLIAPDVSTPGAHERHWQLEMQRLFLSPAASANQQTQAS